MRLAVAIVGRPNVGKSTLFNRLAGRRAALVDSSPGVTRDWREAEADFAGLGLRVIDTAGYEEGGAAGSLPRRMWQQTEAALAAADVALLLLDARAGVTPADEEFARRLRAGPAPVILVANKCESTASDAGYYDAFALGLGEPVAISAEHGEGLAELHAALAPFAVAVLPAAENGRAEVPGEEAGTLRLAVVGRPNVGKSTLVNRLLKSQRMLTGPEPGITRDAVAVAWEWRGRRVELIDTAGLRKRARATERLKQMSAAATRRAVRLAHVVVLVLDGTEPLGRADLSAANLAIEEGRALVLVLNKWDLVTARRRLRRELDERLADALPQVKGVPVAPLSALTGEGLEKLVPAAFHAHLVWDTRIPTATLNRWLAEIIARQPPPMARGRRVRLHYVTQAGVRPPTFVVFANRPAAVPDSYVRFAVNDLRERFRLPGVPIRLNLRHSRGREAA